MNMPDPSFAFEVAPWHPGNDGLDAEVIPLDTVCDLLITGINQVQNAYDRKGVMLSADELTGGLDNLRFMGQLLGSARFQSDPLDTTVNQARPAMTIIDNALMAIVLSPLNDADKLPLVDQWVAACSSGPGKTSANSIFAKHRAASTVAEYAERVTDVPYFGEFARTLDKRYGNGKRFMVAAGVAVAGTALAVKHFLSR